MRKIIRPELEASVKNLGEIYRLNVSFDQALKSLRNFGIKNPISIRDLAYARIQKGRCNSLSRYGSYTGAGFLHLKNEAYLLALNSPLLDLELASQAVEVNRAGKYFSTGKDFYDKYKEIAEIEKNKEPENRSVLILSERKNYEIPTNRFNENELTKFLFKDQAENYGNFLSEDKTKRIDKMPVWLVNEGDVDIREETVLTQLWSHNFNGSFSLDGYYRDFSSTEMIRGVIEKTSEANL